MKSRIKWSLALVLTAAITLAVRAQEIRQSQIQTINVEPINAQPIELGDARISPMQGGGGAGPVNLIDVIPVPAPILSTDISWVDQATGRFFLTDRTNKSIDVFDANNDVFVAAIPGFVGTPAPNGAGPNGVLVDDNNFLWVGDGNSLLQQVDLNVYPWKITHTIPVGGAADGRADELGYDPVERVILIANDASTPPRLTFVSVDTFQVLGQVKLPDATGLEQPVWDQQLHRFLVTVPSSPAYVAVVDPRSMRLEKKHTFPRCSGGVNGLALGPNQHIIAVGCSVANILNAIDGRLINLITQIPGGDEVWYNSGDNRFYVQAADATGITQLGVIDAQSGQWLQNVPANGIRNASAFAGNNHILAPVRAPAAGTRDTSVCTQFGVTGTGCIAVFSHL